jgi:dipeptidyl aminopeptidase
LIIALGSLVFLAAVIGLVAAITYHGSSNTPRGYLKMTMDHIANGTFRPDTQQLLWVPEGDYYIIS